MALATSTEQRLDLNAYPTARYVSSAQEEAVSAAVARARALGVVLPQFDIRWSDAPRTAWRGQTFVTESTITVYLRADLPPWEASWIVLHELGHVVDRLRLPHMCEAEAERRANDFAAWVLRHEPQEDAMEPFVTDVLTARFTGQCVACDRAITPGTKYRREFPDDRVTGRARFFHVGCSTGRPSSITATRAAATVSPAGAPAAAASPASLPGHTRPSSHLVVGRCDRCGNLKMREHEGSRLWRCWGCGARGVGD